MCWDSILLRLKKSCVLLQKSSSQCSFSARKKIIFIQNERFYFSLCCFGVFIVVKNYIRNTNLIELDLLLN